MSIKERIKEVSRKVKKVSDLLEQHKYAAKIIEGEKPLGILIVRITNKGIYTTEIGLMPYEDVIRTIEELKAEKIVSAILGDERVIPLTGEENE